MRYNTKCENGHVGLVSLPMEEASDERIAQLECQACGARLRRLYAPLPVHYNTQGFHKTDYNKYGDIRTQLNDGWSKYTGEEPPPVSKEVPINSSEPW